MSDFFTFTDYEFNDNSEVNNTTIIDTEYKASIKSNVEDEAKNKESIDKKTNLAIQALIAIKASKKAIKAADKVAKADNDVETAINAIAEALTTKSIANIKIASNTLDKAFKIYEAAKKEAEYTSYVSLVTSQSVNI